MIGSFPFLEEGFGEDDDAGDERATLPEEEDDDDDDDAVSLKFVEDV